MGEDFEVIGRIVVDSSGAVGLQGVDDKLQQIGEHSSGLGGITQKLGSIMDFVWGNLIARGIEEAATKLVDFVKESVSAAEKAQVNQSQLEAVIKSTGSAAGYTAGQIEQMAAKYSTLTGFENDQIIAGETVLLQFTKIGHDILPQASMAAMDLARRTGMDLTNAFQTVGRALAMPEQGVGRLNMAYKLFDKDQLKVIEDMAKGGNVAGAQALILDALNQKIGGAAKAYGETYAGRLAIFNAQVEELKESIGFALLPVLSKLISLVIDSGIIDSFKSFFDTLKSGGVQIPILTSALHLFGSWWSRFGGPIVSAGERIWASIERGYQLVAPILTEMVNTILTHFAAWFMKNGPLIDKFVNKIADVFTYVLIPAITVAIATVGPIISSLVDIFEEVVTLFMQIATGDWAGAWDTIKSIATSAWNGISSGVMAGATTLVKQVGGTPNNIGTVWSNNWNQFTTIVSKLFTNLVATARGFITNFIQVGASIIDGLIQGVENNVSAFVNTIKNVVQNAITTATTALGIQSPSKVFAGIGKNMMLGLSAGIGDGLNIPINMLSRGIPQLGVAASGAGPSSSFYNNSQTSYSRRQHFGSVNNYYISSRPVPADTVKNLRKMS